MINKMKKPAFWLGVIGAVKLFTDSMGYSLVSDEQVDAIANGAAAVFAVVGVWVSHDS